jgi:small subunit ribosomal protein S6
MPSSFHDFHEERAPTGRNPLREYETTFIVQPEISDEGSQAILSKLDDVLETGGATRLMCEDHGKRKLAYEVRKFHKGHYYTLMFLNDGTVVPDLERVLRLEESVLRFLTIQAEEEVADVEARKAAASEAEQEQTKRAEERVVREAEEAAARRAAEEAEREASLLREAEAAVAAAAAATEKAEGESGDASEPAAEAAVSATEATPESAASESETEAAEAAGEDAAAAEPTEEKS